jgi:hypothetical protein
MRYVFSLLLVGLAAFLTGCSSIAGAIIGERSVASLFGLDNRVIVFSLSKKASSQLMLGDSSPAQITSAVVNVPLEVTFNDTSLNLPLGVVPRGASEELGMSPTVEMISISRAVAFPEQLGLTNPELDMTLVDGSGAPSVRQLLTAPGTNVTFNKATCGSSGIATVCQYQATQSELYFFKLSLEGEAFQTLFKDILQSGAKTNQAQGVITLGVSASGSVPLDSTFKLTLKTRNSKIRF